MLKTALVVLASLVLMTGCAEAIGDDVESTEEALRPAAPLGEEPKGEATKYPLVLVHGFLGSADGFASFHARIGEALVADGHDVHRVSLPPLGDVEIRSRALAEQVDEILARTGAEKVNLVAHSMGGLDARVLVSTLGYGDRVASLTTISTPHRGSRIADVGLGFVSGAKDDALDSVAKLFGAKPEDADLVGALVDLAEKSADAFNAAHPDDPRVYYQSWAGVSSVLAIPNRADRDACEGKLLAHPNRADHMHPLFVPGVAFVAHGKKPNDGLVLVSSAKWGNFRGCIPADHADEIGVFSREPLDKHSGFDFVRFHRNVAFDLAARGF